VLDDESLSTTPDLPPLSHNECCGWRAAANANKNLVSRKLAYSAPEGFLIWRVKGQDYLFEMELQVSDSQYLSVFVSNKPHEKINLTSLKSL
jgi:hypothetical protein